MANQTSRRGAEPGNQRAAKANKAERKDPVIGFRVTQAEKTQLEAAAAAEGLRLSAWVRQRCGLAP